MNKVSLPKRLTSTDAAKEIGISRATLNRMRERGEGPECIQVGTRFLYEPAKIKQWLEEQRRAVRHTIPKTSAGHQSAA